MATEDDSDIPDSGAVFTFGKSRFGDSAPSKFWIRDDQVTQVACGDEHTALVSACGKLFTFGSNDWGQLGLGHNKITNKPSRVKALKSEKVKLVTCGRTHTLVFTDSGKLFSFGNNGEGQLGIGSTDGQNQRKPIQVEGMQSERIKMLSAGNEQSVALTESGDVYVWGGNDSGQCGMGDRDEISTPVKLPLDEPVTCISCGYYHTAFVTESGKLLTCGEAEDDKLGLDTDDDCVKTPQEVQGIDGKVIHVACGGKHTIAITDSGAAYTFGDGSSGQLGLGTKIQRTPTPVKLETVSERLILASCGENHTAVIAKSGLLYTFGDGRHGKLALGEENFANQFRPTHVSRFDNFIVQAVTCGGCHMLVSAKRGLANGHIMNGQHSTEEAEDEVDSPPILRPHPQKRMSQMDHLRESMDLEGSIGARNRRREKLPEPSASFTGRTLPPLNSSFTSGAKHPLTSTQTPTVSQSLDSGLSGRLQPISRTLEMPVSSAPPPAEEKEKNRMAAMKEDEEDSSDVSVTESEDDEPKEGNHVKTPQAKPRPVPRLREQPELETEAGDKSQQEDDKNKPGQSDGSETGADLTEDKNPQETTTTPKNDKPVAALRPKAVSYEDQKPKPVRRQLAPLQAKGKKLDESEEESEEETSKKKGKSKKEEKKKEKDKKVKPPPKKKGLFGKKTFDSDEDEESEEESEEELKEKPKKGSESKKKSFYNDSEEEDSEEEEAESQEEIPTKSKKELEKERKEKEKKEREKKKKEEKEKKEKEKQAEKERKEKERQKKEQQKKKEKEAQKKKGAKASEEKKKSEEEESKEEEEDSLEEVTDEESESETSRTEKNDKTSDKETKEESKEDKTPPAKPTPQKKSSTCTIL